MTSRSNQGLALAVSLFFSAAPSAAQAPGAASMITSIAGTEACSNLTASPAGDLYFVGEQGYRKMAAATGAVSMVAKPVESLGGGIAADAAGNLYLAYFNRRVVKLAAGTGAIAPVAGTGEQFNGVNNRIPGPALNAVVDRPGTLALDSAGDLYIGHQNGVWKVTTATGLIAAVPLRHATNSNGVMDPIPGLNQPINPAGLAFDVDGNMYIADSGHEVVWKVPATGGILKRVAGTGEQGYNGDGMPATLAKLSPTGVAFDASGNLFIAEGARVRMVAKSDGAISTVAGNGIYRNSMVNVPGPGGATTQRYQKADDDNGPANKASIDAESIAFDRTGNLYLCGGIIRKVTGIGRAPAVGGSGGEAHASSGAALPPGSIVTVAGNGTRVYSGDGVPATGTGLPNPVDVAVDPVGNLFITDTQSYSVLRVAAGSGIISRVAGTGKLPASLQSGDGGPATSANLFNPLAAVPDSAGDLYIADRDGAIRQVHAGTITSLIRAQNSAQSRFAFSPNAIPLPSFDPLQLAAGAPGTLYIVDAYIRCIKRFTVADKSVTGVAGNCAQRASGPPFSGEGGPATNAQLGGLSAVALDKAGNLYIADLSSQRIRKVDAATGILTTIAGIGDRGDYGGDGGPALKALFNGPTGIAVDGAGNVFIADSGNNRVRKIAAGTGIITTIAGTGSPDYGGDGGPASTAPLSKPTALATDAAGNLYIADTGNNRARKVIAARSH